MDFKLIPRGGGKGQPKTSFIKGVLVAIFVLPKYKENTLIRNT